MWRICLLDEQPQFYFQFMLKDLDHRLCKILVSNDLSLFFTSISPNNLKYSYATYTYCTDSHVKLVFNMKLIPPFLYIWFSFISGFVTTRCLDRKRRKVNRKF